MEISHLAKPVQKETTLFEKKSKKAKNKMKVTFYHFESYNKIDNLKTILTEYDTVGVDISKLIGCVPRI